MQPYSSRRERLADSMQALGGGIAIVATAREVMRNADADYPFRHDSYFYYLTGFTEPESVVVVISGNPTRSILFCREKNLEREIWDGYRFGPAAACAEFGFDEAYPISALNEHMPRLLAQSRQVFHALGHDAQHDTELTGWLRAVRGQVRSGVQAPRAIHDVRLLLDEMRLFKDDAEVAILKRAGKISADAHCRAMRTIRPGQREYHVEAELLHAFRSNGSQFPAYGSIVATGANACVLHYRAGDTEIRDGDMVLIDAGCELDSYASDITRTFPANGVFSPAQAALYEVVLAAHKAAVAATAPGRHFSDAHDAALHVLAQGMLDTGLLDKDKVGNLADVLSSGAYRQFYMHRTGHWMGMDVHDVGSYLEPLSAETTETPDGAIRPSRILRPGMVLTIEPGLYVRPAPGVPEKYWNIGIRIEDDALLTPDGCDLMTLDAPKSIADIEALMRRPS